LHIGASSFLDGENEFAIHFEQKFTLGLYKVRNLTCLIWRKAFETCSSLVQKKKRKKKNISLIRGCPINQ
jgi:hypothetical protein